ncbi:MAG: SDR family NAD(P)-dependent oxidoreductase, partial [Bacteroidota bacterium]
MRIKPLFNLEGKVAIVTGASKGIGEAMARGLAEFGAKVVISSRKQDAVNAVAQNFRTDGLEATGIACHVGDATQRVSLRPCELSYPAVVADISKYCQTWFEGNSALTVCDATCFDFGMEAAQETFGLDGRAILREPSCHERRSMIGNIWFEKTKTQDEENPRVPQFPIHLNEVWQDARSIGPKGRRPGVSFPVVNFAPQCLEDDKMPPIIVYLRYRTAMSLEKTLQ